MKPKTAISYWRQFDLLSPDQLSKVHITMIGCGGIGSFAAFALAKLGVQSLDLWDADIVEPHNLPTQNFRPADVGKPKAEALASALREHNPTLRVETHTEFYQGQTLRPGIVISGVDSMLARKTIWKALKYNPRIQLYIEGRMGAQDMRLYSINPCSAQDHELYEAQLYDDADALPERCTEKSIIYTVFFISYAIANQVKRFLRKEPIDRELVAELGTLSLLKNP